MIVELGHYALVLALGVAIVQAALPLAGAARRSRPLMEIGAPAALAQLLLVGLSFAALTHAYVVSDFSVRTVAQNSHTLQPLLYRITGVWGNHEGSLLLWSLILALFGAAVAAFGGNLPPSLKARVLGIQALIGVGFLSFMLFTSNPFARLDPPAAEGAQLNPLLQDPGLAFHPPMLYLGYVGFSIAFSFAIAALLEGRVDAAWARWVRPWTLAAWTALTAGIGLGSWWAYYELGWGGWWFWDPVENASFMPWLVGTALLHSSIVVEKRDALKSWTILLAILTFALSLLGTFIVRSGVITSVHSFASDPARGLFILVLLAIAIGGSLALFALRGPALAPGGHFAAVSREGALIVNNLLLSVAAAIVFMGTLFPLFGEAFGVTVSVGFPYYNKTFVPVMVPLAALTAVGPLLAWKRGDIAGALQRLQVAGAAALGIAAITWYLHRDGPALAALGVLLGVWLIAGSLVELAERVKLFRAPFGETLRRAGALPRAAWGMTLAHAGLGILILGITGSSAWKVEEIRVMRPGETVTVAGYDYRFDGVTQVDGPNYRAERGQFTVTRDGAPVAVLTPEKRNYLAGGMPTTEAGIHTTGIADLYTVVGDPDGKGGWTVRLFHEPLVPWIWAGVLTMVAGGLVSLSDRRLRVGAPARRRAAALASGT
ncbi:MAG: cytochrome c biogenesis protein CcmF [Alphaproteobacteria bacterium]|nr:MAG: cytochrome c biogenesis protein CcmF [Alphaproteobacteria bacterium]